MAHSLFSSPLLTRLPLLLMGMVGLVSGVLAGLGRLSVEVPSVTAAQAGHHGALMIAAFLGTVISLERAVALRGAGLRWPFLAPLAAGLGGVTLLLGLPSGVGQALFVGAGSVLAAGSLHLFWRQPVMHLAVLALGALLWLGGNLLWALEGTLQTAVPWWMGFLVLTIAGERLELTRFLPIRPRAKQLFLGLVALLLLALFLTLTVEILALKVLGGALLGLAVWLLRQDIARRTVKQSGLTRYIAVCLLSGYAWLALGGILGGLGGFEPGHALRDAALHSIFLGFVFAMIFGHAPIIFPAVAKVRIPYHPAFYVPLSALHLTVLGRVVGDLGGLPSLVQMSAIGNALTLLLFVLTLLSRIFFAASPKDASM